MSRVIFDITTAKEKAADADRQQLAQALKGLKKAGKDYLLLQPQEPFNGCVYLKASAVEGGFFLETAITDGESVDSFRVFREREDMVQIMTAFYDMTALPDIRGWQHLEQE